MEPDDTSRSHKTCVGLPFEVLGIIFAYYVGTETLFHPLETLLLVSRLWNHAALGHKALWGDLHIHLGHMPTHDYWRVLLPRRLQRARSAPLGIEIRYALEGIDHPYYRHASTCAWEREAYKELDICTCAAFAAHCTRDLLEILAGPKGEYCKRWTRLHIILGGCVMVRYGEHVTQFQPSLSCDPLSHPMPLLESIHLKGLRVFGSAYCTLFSSTPSVRTVHFERCDFDSLDGVNFSSTESITIQDIDIIKGGSNLLKFDPPTSIKAIHIEGVPIMSFIKTNESPPNLHIEHLDSLPNLHTLHLGGHMTTHLIAPHSNFPSLKSLTVPVLSNYDTTDLVFFEKFASSAYHPLSTVKELTLSQTHPFSRVCPFSQQIMVTLKPFLEEMKSVERITGSREVLATILKYMLEANMQREGSRISSNLSGRTVQLVNSDTGSMVELMFDEKLRGPDICAASRSLDVPDPSVPWEQFLRNS